MHFAEPRSAASGESWKVMIEVADHELPEAWRLAYERDCTGEVISADPSPERHTARALAAFILTGLAFLALPGTFLGVWNLLVISEHRAATAASTAWIQAHGLAQLFGWVGSFILGISLYVLPKFRGRPLKIFGTMWLIWALWTAGVAWRWWAGIGTREWRAALVGSATLKFVVSPTWIVCLPGSASSSTSASRGEPEETRQR